MNVNEFWSRVEQRGDCWQWTGGANSEGYGYVRVLGKYRRAHRYAYELMVGEIPVGLVLDHLCRNPRCVNPEHLDPVTNRINVVRGHAAAGLETRCRKGHEREGGVRHCRACNRENARRYEARKRAEKAA